MKRLSLIASFLIGLFLTASAVEQNPYIQRFIDLRDDIHDEDNGYFSKDKAPYHSIEELIVEAPDYGHQSTSEVYSYWIWLEAMYGRVTGDWSPLNEAWRLMEDHIIPSSDQQPTNSFYDPESPATYMAEHEEPTGYPSKGNTAVQAGFDPLADELYNTYGNYDIYGMHWLLDCDNFFGFGNKGDGVSTPSYMNTFQRGEQESIWEVVPHPSWEAFQWGDKDNGGYLSLFVDDSKYAEQWRYTNAPDADARAVQAMYWAYKYAEERGDNPNSVLPMEETKKMGDYLRYSMFDKYFRTIGEKATSQPVEEIEGVDNAHYLMSWYYAWGGAVDPSKGWAFRIGSSHNHFGYQNPVCAYVLGNLDEFTPASPTAKKYWEVSYKRQLEFYKWLQSGEGAIAGGATNSWNGRYEDYPAGLPTFYGMCYDDHPVYHDPVSNSWFGWQAWSVQRVAEIYYMTNDEMAKDIMDKWVEWVLPNINLIGEDDFEIPVTMEWTGQPDTWDPSNPGDNNNLHVEVTGHNRDVGITASLAKTLIYYAAATQKFGTRHEEAKEMAKQLLDRQWNTYRTEQGVAVVEQREDFKRFFDEVYIPEGFSGVTPDGVTIEPGVTFIELHDKYNSLPEFVNNEEAIRAGTYESEYHRTWAQMEVALANADYGYFFGDNVEMEISGVANNSKFDTGEDIGVVIDAIPEEGTVDNVEFFVNGESISSDDTAPYSFTIEDAQEGEYIVYAQAKDSEGRVSSTTPIKFYVGNRPPVANVTASIKKGYADLDVIFSADGSSDADGDRLTYSWDFGDGSTASGLTTNHTYTKNGEYEAVVTVSDGSVSETASVSIEVLDPNTDLKLHYMNGSSGGGQMKPCFKIVNEGPATIPLSELTIRYFFDSDGITNNTCAIDYSPYATNLIKTFVATNDIPGTTHYLELGFNSSAPSIDGQGVSGVIQTRIHDQNWASYTESNDYSFSANQLTYGLNDKVCLYRNGQLVWGIEPVSSQSGVITSNSLDATIAGVKVYPNPIAAGGQLHIDLDENTSANVKIFSLSGKVVFFANNVESSITIGSEVLPQGFYMLQINTENQSQDIKLSVK